ncbi:MAG: DUF389 domain-containing protein [Bacteroidales bacterium]|nr:DUF389 domain-containing protein [Bacteroidales bacterium]
METNFWGKIATFINVRSETDIQAANLIIRKNIHFRGMTVFILACAIIIASVGLNLNSIPVIIGAMLISPVMGPILGFGLGLATNDTSLVRDALKNFLIMVGISILASAIYFLLSPLSPSQKTELLARTNPTIYDVLIALFGGAAGMFATSRKEGGTVIPGVAIATALMPPLCTVGYGLAHLDPKFIFGALYLFIINSIFIALATFLVAKYLRFPSVFAEDEIRRKRARRIIGVIMLIIVVPSIISAVQIVRETNFERSVETLVEKNKTVGRSYIFNYTIEKQGRGHAVQLFVAGEVLPDAEKESIYLDAEELGIKRNQLSFHEDAAVRAGIDGELLKNYYEDNARKMNALNEDVKRLNTELEEYKSKELPAKVLALEIASQYDNITNVSISRGESVDPLTGETSDEVLILLTVSEPLTDEALDKMTNWLRVRLETPNVVILQK